jgi:hypothetical protein
MLTGSSTLPFALNCVPFTSMQSHSLSLMSACLLNTTLGFAEVAGVKPLGVRPVHSRGRVLCGARLAVRTPGAESMLVQAAAAVSVRRPSNPRILAGLATPSDSSARLVSSSRRLIEPQVHTLNARLPSRVNDGCTDTLVQ